MMVESWFFDVDIKAFNPTQQHFDMILVKLWASQLIQTFPKTRPLCMWSMLQSMLGKNGIWKRITFLMI